MKKPILAVIALTFIASQDPAIAASLTPLNSQWFTHSIEAFGISADGSTVVGTLQTPSDSSAFRWTKTAGLLELHHPLSGYSGGASATSADGKIIVGVQLRNGFNAFRWTSDSGWAFLNDLSGSLDDAVASDVSDDGSTIIGRGTPSLGDEAVAWTELGVRSLGDLPGGAHSSQANAVSGDGVIIVGEGFSAAGREAFRWTSDTGMVGLGDLPGGDFGSSANGISGDGSTIVGQGASSAGREGFRWSSADGLVGLGDLPGGEFFSVAQDASRDGSIIVGAGFSEAGEEAVLWTSHRIHRLWDVMQSQGIDPAADGWSHLNIANAVSDDGRTIVGRGVRDGRYLAFVATIPEPTSLVLALLTTVFGIARLR
jgi:uncharacterized membrane protein